MQTELTQTQRVWAWTTLLLCSIALMGPALGELDDDSFPLSTYPMFAKQRGKPQFHQLLAYYPHRPAPEPVAPEFLGTSEVLQAKAVIDAVARKGQNSRAKFCEKIRARLKAETSQADVERLELVRVRFDPIAYFTHGPVPLERQVLATCPQSASAAAAGSPP